MSPSSPATASTSFVLSAAPAEVQFSDYRQVNGILLPFAVTTLIAGQSASAIQLNQVTFNNNLTDSDFRP